MFDIEPFVYRTFEEVSPYSDTDLRVNCPFCLRRYGKPDYSQKLYISIVKQTVHCFKCEYSKNWIGFVVDVMDCTYIQAFGELYVRPNPSKLDDAIKAIGDTPRTRKPSGNANIPIGLIMLWDRLDLPMLRAARAYMRKRNVCEKLWRQHNVGILPDEMPWRVVIPVEGDYYQARAILKKTQPKYMAPDVPNDNVLFNARALEQYKEVVICEGIFSALAVGDNALALLGSNGTTEKLRRLLDSTVAKFVLTVENNAHYKMDKIARTIEASGRDVELWIYEGDDDPADGQALHQFPYDFRAKLLRRMNGRFA